MQKNKYSAPKLNVLISASSFGNCGSGNSNVIGFCNAFGTTATGACTPGGAATTSACASGPGNSCMAGGGVS